MSYVVLNLATELSWPEWYNKYSLYHNVSVFDYTKAVIGGGRTTGTSGGRRVEICLDPKS